MVHLPEEFPTGVFGWIVLGFPVLHRRQEVDDVVFSADSTVDLHVQRDKHAMGETFMKCLDSCGVSVMIQQGDRFIDQRDRGFIEPAAQRNGSVPIHLSGGLDTEVVV